MPTPPELAIFRSELQARLLGLILLNPDETWTTSQLAERVRATPVAVHRELHRLLDGGLVTREALGRMYLYGAATESPLYDPLRALLERTVGVEVELRKALEGFPGLQAAFLHGSHARGTKIRPMSDVDVLVIGAIDYQRLRRTLREVERRIGRQIDVLAYRRDEFEELVRRGNSLALEIIGGPVKPLVGTRSDLPEAA